MFTDSPFRSALYHFLFVSFFNSTLCNVSPRVSQIHLTVLEFEFVCVLVNPFRIESTVLEEAIGRISAKVTLIFCPTDV